MVKNRDLGTGAERERPSEQSLLQELEGLSTQLSKLIGSLPEESLADHPEILDLLNDVEKYNEQADPVSAYIKDQVSHINSIYSGGEPGHYFDALQLFVDQMETAKKLLVAASDRDKAPREPREKSLVSDHLHRFLMHVAYQAELRNVEESMALLDKELRQLHVERPEAELLQIKLVIIPILDRNNSALAKETVKSRIMKAENVPKSYKDQLYTFINEYKRP